MSSNQPSAGNINDQQQSSTPTSDDDIRKAFELNLQANECMKTAKFNETIQKFNQAISLYPFPAFFCNRAGVFCSMHRFNNAINDCHNALKLDSKCARAFAILGLAFNRQNRYNDAVDAYKKALEFEPENEDYKRGLAGIEEKLKAVKQESSPPTFEDVTKANAFKEDGNEHMKALKFNEAIEKYTQAIALKVDPVYYCNRSAAFCRLQKYNDAQKDCNAALSLDANYAKALGRLGFIVSCQGYYFYSVNYYKRALELDPNNENYKENLALAEAKLREEAYQRT